MVQILQLETSHKEHVFNQFCWGNSLSLKRSGEETLWNDLKNFYEE